MQRATFQLLTEINRWLVIALLIAQTVLVGRLLYERLVRRYPVFTLYLVVETFTNLLLLWAAAPTPGYMTLYREYLVLTSILRIGVVWELYNRICEHFPGFGASRLRLTGAIILVSAILAFASIPSVAARWGHPRQTLFMIMVQYESEIVAFLLAGIWLFFHLFKVSPQYRPNLLVHWRITTLYFLVDCGHALAILWTGLGQSVHPINTVMLLADLALVIAWTTLLNARGEQLRSLREFSPAQLDALEQKDAELTRFVTNLPRQIATHLK